MAKKKQASGGARLVKSGKRPILLGATPAEKDILDRAAALDGRKTAPFVLHFALIAAKKILGNSDAGACL